MHAYTWASFRMGSKQCALADFSAVGCAAGADTFRAILWFGVETEPSLFVRGRNMTSTSIQNLVHDSAIRSILTKHALHLPIASGSSELVSHPQSKSCVVRDQPAACGGVVNHRLFHSHRNIPPIKRWRRRGPRARQSPKYYGLGSAIGSSGPVAPRLQGCHESVVIEPPPATTRSGSCSLSCKHNTPT